MGCFPISNYKIAVFILLLIPLIGFYSIKLSRGLIKYDGKTNSMFPLVCIPILYSVVFLGISNFLIWNILSWSNFWIPFLLGSFLFLFLDSKNGSEEPKDALTIIITIIFALIYGYGSTLTLNGLGDYQKPQVIKVQVLQKTTNQGKYEKEHFFKLAPWTYKKTTTKLLVPKNTYNNSKVGGSVNVHVHKGFLNIPFYYAK